MNKTYVLLPLKATNSLEGIGAGPQKGLAFAETFLRHPKR